MVFGEFYTYNKSINLQEENANKNYCNQTCNLSCSNRTLNSNFPNLEIPSNSCLKKEMEPPNLDIPCLKDNKVHNFSLSSQPV